MEAALPLKENLDIAVKLLERFQKNELILEIEAGWRWRGGWSVGCGRGQALHHAEDTSRLPGASIQSRVGTPCRDLRQCARGVQSPAGEAETVILKGVRTRGETVR